MKSENEVMQKDEIKYLTKRDGIIKDVIAEIDRAEEKFPDWPTDAIHAFAVLGEECGELNKAVLQCTYERQKSNLDDVRGEAIQTAAMAIRFLMSLDKYDFLQSPQHQLFSKGK